MKYLLVIILCLLSTTASARHVEVQRDLFGNEVRAVTHHHVHHARRHHRNRTNVRVDVRIPIPVRRDLQDVFQDGFFPLRYPYATGTAILDAYSGRIPVTYCASHTDFIMGW